MKKVILWKCPHCGSQHALVSLERKGSKRSLGVHCDDSGRLAHTRFVPLPQSTVDAMDENDPDLQNLPTFVTAPAKREAEAKNNLGLVLMFPAPGQQVERNVELPRAPLLPDGLIGYPDDASIEPETDIQAATRLKLEIDQKLQAAQELDDQIRSLESRRRKLKDEAKALGADLSRVQTGKLFDNKEDAPCP